MSRRLKRQLSSKTFRTALLGAVAEGGKTFIADPVFWWISVGLGLVAWVGLGFYAEDQN